MAANLRESDPEAEERPLREDNIKKSSEDPD
jgi:hypothetical protein